MRSKFYTITLSRFDSRLRPTDRNVLDALCFFSRNGKCQADRKTIGLFAGIPETRVSEHTTRLHKFGWIEKIGGGKGTEYFINWDYFPAETVTDSVTVLGLSTVTDSVTVENDPTVTTVTDSVTVGTGATEGTITKPVTVAPKRSKATGGTITDSVTVGTGATGGTITKPVTVRTVDENQGATISSNKYINIIFNNNSYPIRSDLIRSGDKISFVKAAEILNRHGCRYDYKKNPQTTGHQAITEWEQAGIPVCIIEEAIKQAAIATPSFGPRYVTKCIETILASHNDPGPVPPANDHKALDEYGRMVGVTPGRHDDYHTYRQRIVEHVQAMRASR